MKYDHPNGEAYPEDEDPGQDLPSTSLGCVGPDGVPAGQTFNIQGSAKRLGLGCINYLPGSAWLM